MSWRKLVFNDMLMSNFTPEQRDLMSSLVDESEVDGETLYQTMVNLGRCFETRHDSMLRDGIDASNKYEHLPSPTGDIFAYDRVFVTEALKNSAPPGTPESPDERGRCEDYYGRVRLARLFGKYGNRLKNLRDMLGNPYAPVGYSIAFGPETEAEREQLLAELSQDIFGQGEFGRIGAAMKEKAFQDYCKSQGLDIKPEDGKAEASRKRGVQAEVRAKSDKGATWKFGQESSRSAALQLYIFMQAVHAKYRGQGEQITNANEFGVKGLEPQKVTFDVLLEAMTNVTTETNDDNAVHLRVRQFSQDEADRLIVCPRSRNPYPLTIVHRGVAVEGCSWANIQRAVSVLSENPYTREYTLNIARNQGAYRAFHDLTRQGQLRAGDVAINTRIRDMLTQQEVDTHHRVFAELDMADAAGTAVNLDVAERTLHDIQNNALRSTAHYLGIGNPDEVNLEDLGEFFKEFCNGVLQANQGRYANYVEDGKTKKGAVTALSSAYTYAKRFQYTGEGVDLRVITLNTRGWVKAEAAKQIPLATNRELRASYQGSLDDFTAAWHTSRGESPDLALNPARWVIGKPIQWFRDRFANIRRERVEGENAEAMAGMGVMNANITNVSRAAGEEIRKWMLRTAAWSVPAAPFTAGISLIPGAVAIGLVVATERLHISNDWTERAMEEFNNNPQPAHMDYLGDYLDRTIRYSRAQTLVNHGDHSWFRFLRQFWGTFRMDYRAMDRYEHAASILDPLTHDHVLHASSSTVSDRQQHPEVMQDLYFDTFSSRLLKRTALEACGRYYPAAWGTLNTNTFPTTAMPPVEQNACAYRRLNPDEYEFGRLYELAHRNNNLDRGWLRTVCDSTGLNYIGKRVAVSDMLKYVSNHPDPGEPRSVGVNNRAAILLKTIAATETNPHLIAGYMERAREQWAIARDKWAAILQRDLILVHAEAERDLLINGQAYLHDSPPPRMHR